MAILDEKYVFHIPLSKYENGRLIELEIDDILDELLSEFESFNITRIESHYKSRSYDELLITVFTSKKSLETIFMDWFLKNNEVLCQEAMHMNITEKLFIENMK